MNKNLFLVLCFWLSGINFQNNQVFAAETVAIIYAQNNSTYAFAASEIKKGLEVAGFTVILADIGSLSQISARHRVIITVRGSTEANKFLSQPDVSPLPVSTSEGYSIRKKIYANTTDWYIIGTDKNGALYGAQDFTRSVQANSFNGVVDSDKKPYIANRGIKFNIPLDARTPSYSDNGDAAQKNMANMWDVNFWHELLDNMARDRFNMLSLWSLAPFPSMVHVPEYPQAGLADVKKTTYPLSGFKTIDGTNMSNANVLANLETIKTIALADKIKFWQHIMQYASDRGIDCYLFTWNTYTFGTEDSGYGFTAALTDAKTKDYFRKATKALISTYPLLKGIGITAGENLNGSEPDKESFLYGAYGQGINDALAADPNRTLRLIHRAHQANIGTIKTAFSGLNPRCSLEFSFKYSQAHVYSSVAPDYIHKANFLSRIKSSKFFLTLRDDDYYYLRGGSDPAFVRAYIKNMPATNLSGFYLGPDGYTWGREYVSKDPESPNQLVYNKRWYSFSMWGKLAYDPDIPDVYFVNSLKNRFPQVNAQNLHTAWAKASEVITWVNRFHNGTNQLDYQWYPEACFYYGGFQDINKFISSTPQSGEGLMSIPTYADAIINNTALTGTTPLQVAHNLQTLGEQTLSLVTNITGPDKELRQTAADITAMAYLGQYYSKKILGATYKHISDKISDAAKKEQYKNMAITNLRDASEFWRSYASQMDHAYLPQWLTRMQRLVNIAALQPKVDNDILLAGGTINRVAVTGVSINPTAESLAKNSTRQLTATVSPANATNRNLRWLSGNNVIATVNANGLVTGVSKGNTTITATTLDGNKVASCTITVTDNISNINILGSWVLGITHSPKAGSNRALVVFIYGEHSAAMGVKSVWYGGQLMTPVIQKSQGNPTHSYTGAFVLPESGIAAAVNGSIAVTWAATPSSGSQVMSAFLANVNQLNLIRATASGGSTSAATVSTGNLSGIPGDMVLVAATAAFNEPTYAVNNGFTKGMAEQSPAWGDIVAGYKIATGTSETPGVTMPRSMRQSIIAFNLIANTATTTAYQRSIPDELSLSSTKESDVIKVYANPVVHETLIIDLNKLNDKGSIQLFNLSGKLLKSVTVDNEVSVEMNISDLAKGVYILKIKTNHTATLKRIIKE